MEIVLCVGTEDCDPSMESIIGHRSRVLDRVTGRAAMAMQVDRTYTGV